MTNQRLSELRHKGYITAAEYKEIKNILTAIEDIKQEIENLADSEDSMLIGSWGQGLKDALGIIYKHTKGDTETWNGIHGQVTAPNGTFEQIFNNADDEDDI